jgi:anti-sigma factor RsiW
LEQQLAFEEMGERYLLGELSEAEREQFEEAYFADDALFERFLAVKDELLDAYARGELAEAKRKRFEQHFLVSESRRRQLDETREFIRTVSAGSTKAAAADGATVNAPFSVTTPESSWRESFASFFKFRPFAWQTAFAALLLIALGGSWMFVRLWQQQTTRDEQVALQPTPSPTIAAPTNENNNASPSPALANINQSAADANVAVKPTLKNPANVNQSPANTNVAPKQTPKLPVEREPQISPAQIASVMLLPVASRDINEANTLRLSSGTRAVRLRLVFKSDDYRNYSATITTIEGSSVWQQKTLKANLSGANKSVTLQFASALLRQQDYIVTLTGQTAAGQTETIGEYYFRVERSPSQNRQTPTPTPEP